MKPIAALAGRPAAWKARGAFARDFDLVAGDESFATLRWEKAFGSLAAAETAEGRWTFKRAGFLNPRVTARVAGSDRDLATFRPDWGGGGTLVFEHGAAFRLRSHGFWNPRWVLESPDGAELVEFRPEGFTRRNAHLEVKPGAAGLPELPVLVTIGWYLVILVEEDASAAGAVVATS